jgi:hypothetical protein
MVVGVIWNIQGEGHDNEKKNFNHILDPQGHEKDKLNFLLDSICYHRILLKLR